MIKLINIITQIIIILGCCAISIFILFVLITFIKNVDDFAAITNMYPKNRFSRAVIIILANQYLTHRCNGIAY